VQDPAALQISTSSAPSPVRRQLGCSKHLVRCCTRVRQSRKQFSVLTGRSSFSARRPGLSFHFSLPFSLLSFPHSIPSHFRSSVDRSHLNAPHQSDAVSRPFRFSAPAIRAWKRVKNHRNFVVWICRSSTSLARHFSFEGTGSITRHSLAGLVKCRYS
jgi:hypothetical protein